jgi:carboxyl-terminal processing protease
MPHRNLLLLLATLVISYACYVRAEQNPYARYLAAGYSTIDRWSLQEVPDQRLFEAAMQGMIQVLHQDGDEHSAFVQEQQHDDFREELTQQFGGVGIRIRLLGTPPLPTVIGPPEPGTPAYHAEIHSGDRILAIDGESTAKMQIGEVLQRMRGPVGKQVQLALLHAGAPIDIRLTRAMITVDSLYGDLRDAQGHWQFRLPEDPRLGYVRITKFGDKTVAELTRVLADLTNNRDAPPIQGLILDVRDNHGGALDAAVDSSDLFLRAGKTIVTTRGRDLVTRDRFVSTGKGGYPEIPMAILINQESASASEILAACLQDYGRAVVIGQRSYGKGTVQRLFTHLEAGRSLLKLTTATYWRPSEKNIHRMPGDDDQATWGVRPDPGFEIPQDPEQVVLWRRYRSRRDLLGEESGSALADQLDKADGAPPAAYTDQALQRATQVLQPPLADPGA